MSSVETDNRQTQRTVRRRLSREERHRQLLDSAWQVIRHEGTEALSLGRLAEQAGVTKPVVYDHFGTRAGLLSALYQEFDARQTALMDAALRDCEATLEGRAGVIAYSYVDCVLAQGREIPDVIAALAGSPELEAVKHDYRLAFIEKCRRLLAPFASGGELGQAGLWAMLGAADSLSHAAAMGEISSAQAKEELVAIIHGVVNRERN
ncbi:MAG: TetR/AcrR family transcriptional regulator [Neoaquamicrobium sediminum]|uniref:TetR/AcrR family transcriptional regulator n=1 Tax=Neoaquamicrobium sediminum TaxID=1849104 RepID=UPI00403738EE